MQDQPTTTLSVNNCDLTGVGYELRIGDPVPLVMEPLVFKIHSVACISCQTCSNSGRSSNGWVKNLNQCSTFYDMSDLNATFIVSPDFEVDLQGELIQPQT